MSYLPLLGILVLVLGFALRFNPMLVVPIAAITTGLLAGLDLNEVIAKLGKAFNDSRAIIIPWVVLPVDRPAGALRPAAAVGGGDPLVPGGDRRAAADPLSLLSPAHLGDRPSCHAPAMRRRCGRWSRRWRWRRRSGRRRSTNGPASASRRMPPATDNVGLFFGEDIFIAIGSIVLIQQTLEAYQIVLRPLDLALWAIPTAIAAFIIHSARLLMLDRALTRRRIAETGA